MNINMPGLNGFQNSLRCCPLEGSQLSTLSLWRNFRWLRTLVKELRKMVGLYCGHFGIYLSVCCDILEWY